MEIAHDINTKKQLRFSEEEEDALILMEILKLILTEITQKKKKVSQSIQVEFFQENKLEEEDESLAVHASGILPRK